MWTPEECSWWTSALRDQRVGAGGGRGAGIERPSLTNPLIAMKAGGHVWGNDLPLSRGLAVMFVTGAEDCADSEF
jgi:hypothetical protein